MKDKRDIQRQTVEALINTIDITDSQRVIGFGLNEQTELADFAGDLLDQMRSIKTGDIAVPLEQLMTHINAVDFSDFTENAGQPSRRTIKKAEKALARFYKTESQIFSAEIALEKARAQLLRDVVLLGKLKEINDEHKRVLETLIEAGEIFISRIEKDSSTFENKTQISAFEKRVHDLKLARMVSVQMSPQIDLIVSANQTLIDKIQTSLLTTIPLWRNQMVIAHALIKKQSAEAMQKAFMDSASLTLKENAEALIAETERLKKEGGSAAALKKLTETGDKLTESIDACKQALAQSASGLEGVATEVQQIKREIKR